MTWFDWTVIGVTVLFTSFVTMAAIRIAQIKSGTKERVSGTADAAGETKK